MRIHARIYLHAYKNHICGMALVLECKSCDDGRHVGCDGRQGNISNGRQMNVGGWESIANGFQYTLLSNSLKERRVWREKKKKG